MGAEVLRDSDSQVSAKVSEKLAKHVSPGDKVRDVVRKMADKHGARTFRPHNF
jgi:cytochrome c-type biogenesis protein CcmH/NrfF